MFTPLKITDALNNHLLNCGPEYPTRNPFNADNSKVILVYGGFDMLHDVATGKAIKPLKWPIGPSSRPSWDIIDPNKLYTFDMANGIRSYTINDDKVETVRVFAEYQTIDNGGEADISPDGTALVVCGNKTDIFLYDLTTDTKRPFLKTDGRWNALYITPYNNVLVCWNEDTGKGIEMYDPNMKFIRQVAPRISHNDVCMYQGKEYLIWCDNVKNCIMKIPLDKGYAAAEVLYQFTDWTLAAHISAPDSNPGFVYVETMDPTNSSSTVIHANAILRVWLADGHVDELAKHNSLCNTYEGQPLTSSSRDGSKVVFRSNNRNPTPGYADAYLLDLSSVTVKPATDPKSTPAPDQFPGYKVIDFTADEGREWLWHFKVINGVMVVNVYDKV